MSFTLDSPHGFSHCGSFFKILLPKKNKNQHLTLKILSLLKNFETNLTVSIKELIPNDKNGVITLSWMIKAMESLCETHESLATLVMDLELSVSDLEEDLIYMYSDISLKLLELCNAFTSELDRLNHNNLLLKLAFAKLDINNCLEEIKKQNMVSKNRRIEKCGEVLSSFVESVHLLKKTKKKKQSAKGKVLLRAIYGVKVKNLYIFGVFASAFSGSSKNLFYLTIPKEEMDEVPWTKAFMKLQNVINPEIKNMFLSERFSVIKDLEAVESSVKKLYKVVEQEEGSVLDLVEALKKSVRELSERFDLVSKEIRCLTKIVISARDALSESLWKKYREEMGVILPMMIKSVETCYVNKERNM